MTNADMTATAPLPADIGQPQFARGPARRPVAKLADPLLQWSTGLQTTERTVYSGWFLESGRGDDDLDQAMKDAGYKTVAIRHGSGNTVTHWAVEVADLFIVAEGVQSIAELKATANRYGIAYAWRTTPEGRPQSVCKLRAFLRPLLDVEYLQPLLISVKSTLTGDLLAALSRQYDVLDTADAQKGQPLNLPFYAFSLPLGPGSEVRRGKDAQKAIIPIDAHVPAPIERAYLLEHYIKRGWVELVEGLLDETVAWSVRVSEEIAEGVEGV